MKNLFYSTEERVLFLITDCREEGQVTTIISDLSIAAETIAAVAKVPIQCVESYKVTTTSKTYSSMRVFYAQLDNYPNIGLQLGPSWTMRRIIKDWIHQSN